MVDSGSSFLDLSKGGGSPFQIAELTPQCSENKEWMKFVHKREKGDEKGPYVAPTLKAFMSSAAIPREQKKYVNTALPDFPPSQLEELYPVFLNCLTFITGRLFLQHPITRSQLPKPPVDFSSQQKTEGWSKDFIEQMKDRNSFSSDGNWPADSSLHLNKDKDAVEDWPPPMKQVAPLPFPAAPPPPPNTSCDFAHENFKLEEFVAYMSSHILQKIPDKSKAKKLFKGSAPAGRGGFGHVFSYKSTEMGKKVAIKKILKADVSRERMKGMVEVSMLARCDHPNIVKFYGAYSISPEIWMVMEYVQGISFADVARATRLKPKQVAYIVLRVLKALKYIHQILMVHRNIKPANVMINTGGEVKLIDFGQATTIRLTQKKVMGIMQYASPEMMARGKLDGGMDIWALGMSMIEITMGLPQTEVQLIRVVMNAVAGIPPTIDPKAVPDPNFYKFIEDCLVCDPQLRASAESLQSHTFFEEEETIREMQNILKQAIIQNSTIAMQGL
mmetsp:Transcript_7906/g.11943  ORF Transcript_7906/g.11943 Transcript_7906/m.11943 type:complete len:502 (-) Transcript_7906:97-1602(-)